MTRVRLSTLLAAITAVLVLAAAGALCLVAVWLLRELAEEQALARVDLAGGAAVTAVAGAEEATLTASHILGERPTLARLLADRDATGLAGFLARYCATGGHGGCAVVAADGWRVTVPVDLPWAELGVEDGVAYHYWPGREVLLMSAATPVTAETAARTVVVEVLDAAFTRRLGERVGGLEVVLLPRRGGAGPLPAERSVAAAAVVAGGERVVERQGTGDFRAAYPLRAPAGELVGVVEVVLPAAVIEGSLRRFVQGLVGVTAAIGVAAVLAGLALGRSLARPLGHLADAALRIGGGDLVTPIPASRGAEVGTLAATMDDMRRRLLEVTAELRRRENEAHALLEGIVEGVFAVDAERHVRYLNRQAASLLGVAPDDALGRFCGDVLRPREVAGERPCATACPIVHARSRGRSRATEHLELAGGQRRTVVITSAPPEEGRQVQVLRDETDVEGARRLRDAILANISHEFKTPLAAQQASLELLREGLDSLDAGARRELVESLERSTLRLSQLVDNLLESVRVEAGETRLRRRPVALDEVLEEATELTAPLFAQRRQQVETRVPFPLPSVAGDAPRLTQVFVNLLANASKFAPPGSRVAIVGEVGESAVTLRFEDQGPGLPVADGGSVFDRFYRAPGDEPAQAGVGLGLWIVKSIVERHGGTVDAASLPGGGSRFTVTLPLETVPLEDVP